jgi:hypothetical protein
LLSSSLCNFLWPPIISFFPDTNIIFSTLFSNDFSLRFPFIARHSTCRLLSRWFFAWLILRPCRYRRNIPPKHLLTFNSLHGIISQKIQELWTCILIARWGGVDWINLFF